MGPTSKLLFCIVSLEESFLHGLHLLTNPPSLATDSTTRMENQDTTPFSPEANQASSETERHPDTFPYDNDEEMILLQMAEVNDAPPTPGLKAAMEKSQYPNETVGQQQSMPFFMERPKSSGIDVTAFCFAKPSGRNFSVKSSKPSTTKLPARELVQGKPGPAEGPAKQNKARSDESVC